MRILYLEDGTILAAGADDQVLEGRSLLIPDAELPDDFVSTFPLGKYRIRKGKLHISEEFRDPAISTLADLGLEPLAGMLEAAKDDAARPTRPPKEEKKSGKPSADNLSKRNLRKK